MGRLTSTRTTVLILGATSYIAKGLICSFTRSSEFEVILIARDLCKLKTFLSSEKITNVRSIDLFKHFTLYRPDVIINCLGPRDYSLEGAYSTLTYLSMWDTNVIDYLMYNPDALYIYFSSGVVYGDIFEDCATESSKGVYDINRVTAESFYGINKLYAEYKHRSLQHLNIVDIRLFSYFSRFIPQPSHYFLVQVVNSIKNQNVLVTTPVDIIRDYLHPEDLFQLISLCMKQEHINDAIETFTLAPVSKFEILSYFSEAYNLKYSLNPTIELESNTGNKIRYFTTNYTKAQVLGYQSNFSSLETIKDQIRYLL